MLNSKLYNLVVKSPLEKADKLSALAIADVYLKREDLQEVHSFKIRGAYNKMLSLTDSERTAGVIAASAGNHAQGVALSAKKLGIKAVIVMPKTTPEIKVSAVLGYGAEVVLHGDNYSEAQEKCNELIKTTGMTFVHPFDDELVIEGQGTIGTEILEQLPGLTHVFVCVGGGGMLAGIAKAIKAINPKVKIISVEPVDSNAMQASVNAGRLVELNHVGIFADGVAVKRVGQNTFDIARTLVDDFITVSIDEICAGIKYIYEDTRSIVEPAGALGGAGLMTYKLPKNSKVVAICSGANMSFERLQFIAERTLVGSGREALYSVEMPETAGALRTFCREVVNGHSISEFNYRKNGSKNAHILLGINIAGPKDKLQLENNMAEHGYKYIDFTLDETAKDHIRHMIGGSSNSAKNEIFYNINFPERPKALQDFLNAVSDKYNISLFHYRSLGGDIGRVLIGFECDKPKELETTLKSIGYEAEKATSKTIDIFLK